MKKKKKKNQHQIGNSRTVEILALHQIGDGRNANGPGVTEPYTDRAHSMTD